MLLMRCFFLTAVFSLIGNVTLPSFSYNGQTIDSSSPESVKDDLNNKTSALYTGIVSLVQPEVMFAIL